MAMLNNQRVDNGVALNNVWKEKTNTVDIEGCFWNSRGLKVGYLL